MFQYLYEWTRNLAFYMVLVTVVLHTVPDSDYKKYIRFFTGMVLILMMATPILRIFGMDSQIMNFYQSREYEEKIKEIEKATDFLKETQNQGAKEEVYKSTKEQENGNIRVEGIQIEREKEADRYAEGVED